MTRDSCLPLRSLPGVTSARARRSHLQGRCVFIVVHLVQRVTATRRKNV